MYELRAAKTMMSILRSRRSCRVECDGAIQQSTLLMAMLMLMVMVMPPWLGVNGTEKQQDSYREATV